MVAKMAVGLGPRSAWRIFQTLQQLDMPSKDRRQFLTQSGGLIGAMALFSVVGMPSSFLSKTKIENWRQYHDKEYDFALEFPADWSVVIEIQQPTALVDVEAIINWKVNMIHTIKSRFVTLIVVLHFLTSCTLTNTPATDVTNTPIVEAPLEETASEVAATETPSPTNTPLPAKPTSTVVVADALPSPTAEPTEPTATSTTDSTAAAGWAWYEDTAANFTILYPQTWEILPPYREGQTIFSSPETNSQVRIDTWPLSAGQDGLAKVRQDPGRYALTVAPESIKPNATILGQPAFFHFAPSGGYGSPDMAFLLFQVDDQLFNIFYQSGTLPTYKAELAIFRQMLNSFSLLTETAVPPMIPTGWEEGSALVVWREHSDPKETMYQEISGTLTSFDPGQLVITAVDGQTYTIGGAATVFEGQTIDMTAFPDAPYLNEAEQFLFIARPLASGQYKALYTAVMQNGDWQPSMYQSFYDLSYESLPTQFADYFPANEPLHIWLRGTPAQLAPFLASSGEEAWAADLDAAPQALVFGTVENIAAPQLQVEKLYVQTEPCLEDSVAEICAAWRQTFPPVSPTMIITATVGSLLPSGEGFLLAQPSSGFITVQLGEAGQVVDGAGQTVPWADMAPGMSIEATGALGLAGVLAAEKIVVLDK